MKAGMSGAARVAVATLLITFATLGAVCSKAHADPDPVSQRQTARQKVVTIAPVKLIPTPPACGRGEGGGPLRQNYVFQFKTPQHYRYEVKGKTLVSGTSFPADGQTLTVTAVPDSGYTFGKATTNWDYPLTPVRCGG